jgi:hypothetical protein
MDSLLSKANQLQIHLTNGHLSLFKRFPVKDLTTERKKFITQARKFYPNGLPLTENNELDIQIIMKKNCKKTLKNPKL